MAENVSIETIVLCREEETFHESVRCYLQALVSIGIGETTLLEWGQDLRWPEPGERVDTEWPYVWLKAQDESFTTQLRLFIIQIFLLNFGIYSYYTERKGPRSERKEPRTA